MLFEHEGDNRSGKTFLMAVWAFFDWLRGRRVYANCRKDPAMPGGYDCFLNFPHWHYDPEYLYYMGEVKNCTVITDESTEYMDARKSGKDEVLELGYWGKQATKQDIDWHWDNVFHEETEKRIRKKWHFQIRTTRIPKDPNKPLVAIKVESRSRYNAMFKRAYFPSLQWLSAGIGVDSFFPIYNDSATIRRRILET